MRRINANFDAAAYRQQMHSPEVAHMPTSGYTPDVIPAMQAPVAVLDRPVIAPAPLDAQAVSYLDYVAAPPVATDTQVPATSVWAAPINSSSPYEVPHEPVDDPNAFRPINAKKPFDVDKEVLKRTKRIERHEKKEQRVARREAWIGRNAVKATTILFAMSSVVAAATSAGLVYNNYNRPSAAAATEFAAPEQEFTNPYDISTEAETAEPSTTTTSSTSTTTTTQAPAPTTTEAPAPTAPPETVTPSAAFERNFGETIGTLQIDAICLNADMIVYNEDEVTNGTIGSGNAVLDRLSADPAPVEDCATVNERVEPGTITRANRSQPGTGLAKQYRPVIGFGRMADGGYRHVYPCTTGTAEDPVNTAGAGHRSTFGAPMTDLGAVRPGDTAVFTREDGIQCTYVALDTPQVIPYQGDDSHIISYEHPGYASTLTLYGCSDPNGNPGSAESRQIVHWGLVGSEIPGVPITVSIG